MKLFFSKDIFRHKPSSHVFPWLAFVVAALLVVALPLLRDGNSPFTPDEDWTLSWSLYQQAHVGLPSLIVQNAGRYASDNVLLDVWLRLFGTSEPVTRWLSALCLLVALACLFRLARDFWNGQTAVLAVLLLGGLTVLQYFGTRALPYAPSLLAAAGLHLALWRWWRRPTWRRAALYGLFAVLLIYSYPFGVWVIAAQAAVFLLLARWPRERYLQAAALFGVTGLIGAARMLAASAPLILDTHWRALEAIGSVLNVQPPEFGQAMLLLGLAVAAGVMAVPSSHPTRYLLVVTAALLVMMPAGRGGLLQVVFPLLPPLALLAAYTLALLCWPARVAILALYLLPVILTYRTPTTYTTFQDVAAMIQADAGGKSVVAAPYLWQHLPFENGRLISFHILLPGQEAVLPPERVAADNTAAERLRSFVSDSEIVWLVENGETGLDDWYQNVLARDFGASRMIRDNLTYAFDTLTRYLRIPDDTQDMILFQDTTSRFVLKSWTLLDSVDVQPCHLVKLRSWWQGESSVDASLTLVIVNGATGQGAANTDGPPIGQPAYTLRPDRLYADERSVTMPCDAAPGEYPLMLGFYRLADSGVVSLSASLPDGTPLGRLAYLTTLFVK